MAWDWGSGMAVPEARYARVEIAETMVADRMFENWTCELDKASYCIFQNLEGAQRTR